MALPVKLQADEECIAIRKRHPVYVILKGIFAIVVGGVIAWLLGLVPWFEQYQVWIWLAATLLVALYIGILIYRFQNDLWILTNQRLIDSLKRNPFNHELFSTDLINVQDINVHKRGIMATTFNFGDVVCTTASTDGEFRFYGVGDPAGLMEDLDRLRDEARRLSRQEIGHAAGAAALQTP